MLRENQPYPDSTLRNGDRADPDVPSRRFGSAQRRCNLVKLGNEEACEVTVVKTMRVHSVSSRDDSAVPGSAMTSRMAGAAWTSAAWVSVRAGGQAGTA